MKILISLARSPVCKNFRADTETCTTGCPKAKVVRSNNCPFDRESDPEASGPFQSECPCYRK